MNKASRYIYTAPISPYLLHKLFRGKWLCAKKWSPYKLLFHLIHIRGESFPLSNFGFPFFLKRVFLFHESWITFQTNNEAMNEYLDLPPVIYLARQSYRCTAWSLVKLKNGRTGDVSRLCFQFWSTFLLWEAVKNFLCLEPFCQLFYHTSTACSCKSIEPSLLSVATVQISFQYSFWVHVLQ